MSQERGLRQRRRVNEADGIGDDDGSQQERHELRRGRANDGIPHRAVVRLRRDNIDGRDRVIRNNRQRRTSSQQLAYWKLPGLYCVLSAILAALAILTSHQPVTENKFIEGFQSLLFKDESNSLRNSDVDSKETTQSGSFSAGSGLQLGRETSQEKNFDETTPPIFSIAAEKGSAIYGHSLPITSPNVETTLTESGFVPRWLVNFLDLVALSLNGNGSSKSTSKEDIKYFSAATTNKNTATEMNRDQHGKFDLMAIFTTWKSNFRKDDDKKTRRQDLQQANIMPWWIKVIDPCLLNPSEKTFEILVGKIWNSMPRLIAIVNLCLALTFLLHQAVIAWFLGMPHQQDLGNIRNGRQVYAHEQRQLQQQQSWGGNTLERFGGFLISKMSLVYWVLDPVQFDFLIYLCFYTSLSFFWSLVALCARSTARIAASVDSSSASIHAPSVGGTGRSTYQRPTSGILQLLVTIFVCDLMTFATCLGLFFKNEKEKCVLLLSDCAILAFDVCTHILRHWLAVLESRHHNAIRKLENDQDEQFQRIQREARLQRERNTENEGDQHGLHATSASDVVVNAVAGEDVEEYAEYLDLSDVDMSELFGDVNDRDTSEIVRRIDRRMELLEQQHTLRTSLLESAIFGMYLLSQGVTILHFFHLWIVHGMAFGLVDGVLAVQLHSAFASASFKISERRNIHKLEAAMNSQFEDASTMDLRKASAAGDVCSICRGTMSALDETDLQEHCLSSRKGDEPVRSLSQSVLGVVKRSRLGRGNGSCTHVKKLACGHLYHTSCLRAVVETAKSLEAARCPLCRSPVIPSPLHSSSVSQPDLSNINNNIETEENREATDVGTENNNIDETPTVVGVPVVGEHQQDALFRFSTEGIFPAWLPIPAVSFEVIRRTPPPVATIRGTGLRGTEVVAAARGAIGNPMVGGDSNGIEVIPIAGTDRQDPREQEQQQFQQRMNRGGESLFRRLMITAGLAVPTLTLEEELAAMEQLTDMFPQYDRTDLLLCLRQRGSTQAVVDMILRGVFPGRHGGRIVPD